MNSFGKIFRLTSFGESHGVAIGGVIDGCPAGLKIDIELIQADLDRRKPGQSHITTSRQESDCVEILSGIFNGVTTGTPIGFMIKNKDHHSGDYSNLKDLYRPSHADFTYDQKYGVRDYRGKTAVICLDITLKDSKQREATKRILFQKKYRREELLKDQSPRGYCQAMSEAAQKLSQQIITDVYQAIKLSPNK